MIESRIQFIKFLAALILSAYKQGAGRKSTMKSDPARVKKLFNIAGLSEPTDNELKHILG